MIIRCTVKNQFLEIFPNDSEYLALGFNHGGVEGKLHCCCLMERFNSFKSEKQWDLMHPLDTGTIWSIRAAEGVFEVKVESELAASKRAVNGLFNNLPRIYEQHYFEFCLRSAGVRLRCTNRSGPELLHEPLCSLSKQQVIYRHLKLPSNVKTVPDGGDFFNFFTSHAQYRADLEVMVSVLPRSLFLPRLVVRLRRFLFRPASLFTWL